MHRIIFRLSQKLAKKLKVSSLKPTPADPNPFADWSAHLFTADRMQYVILSNTPSLYSTVMYGRGITSESRFLDRSLSSIREFMVMDGLALIFGRYVAPATGTVRFASALNRSVTGSMNDLVYHARFWMTERNLSLFDTSAKLNDIPFSSLEYHDPREALRGLSIERTAHSTGDGLVKEGR